jgi:hypothetical protein
MPASPNKRYRMSALFVVCSIGLLFVNLNFNVRTFRLTQSLQRLTLDLQALEQKTHLMELSYYQQTSLDKIHEKATISLGMVRQTNIYGFTNTDITPR